MLVSNAYFAKLPEQLDEGAFTKGVGKAGMEGQGGIFLGQDGHPTFLMVNGEKRSVVRFKNTNGKKLNEGEKKRKKRVDFIP